MTATAQLLIESLPGDLGASLLAAGVDDAGTPLEAYEDPDGGAPLRCCLRDSRPGERLVLAAVTPPGPRDAYREVGPVFLHAQPCAGPLDEVPPFWSTRHQVLRTYDAAGHLSGGEMAEPGDQLAVAGRLLTDPAVAFVQARNVVHGCFMLTLRRP
jgi:hypothetical protein